MTRVLELHRDWESTAILTLIYRSELWDVLLTAAGLFTIFLWTIPFVILILVMESLTKRIARRAARK